MRIAFHVPRPRQTLEVQVKLSARVVSRQVVTMETRGVKRSFPVEEEWFAEPTPSKHCSKSSAKAGVWKERTQALAKAVLEGDKEIVVQLARMYWAGDPELRAAK